MIISFTNVIGAIQSLVKRVVTDNLKMWLGFETSETLGREEVLNGDFEEKSAELVVDGDFPTGTTAWSKGGDTTIGSNEASFDGVSSYVSQNILVIGKVYECSVRVKTWVSGAALSVGSTVTGSGTVYKEITKTNNTTTTFTFTAVSTTLGIGSRSFDVEGSIDLVSVKQLDPNDRWTLGSGWSLGDGYAENSTSASSSSYLQSESLSLTNSALYQIQFDLDIISATTTTIGLSGTGAFGQIDISDRNFTTSGTKTIEAFYDNLKPNFLRFVGGANTNYKVTNISVKQLTQFTPDKSDNNNVGELFTGKALEFDGSTSYVTADGFAGTLSTDDAFTIVMWFKSNQVSQTQPYFNIQMSGAEDDVNTNVFKFGASANTTLKGIHYQDTPGPTNNYKINNTVNYNDDVWHRLVISREQGTGYKKAKFYVDGGFIGQCDSKIRWDDLVKFSIGQEYDNATPSDYFKGLISDVQIYNKNWLQADVTYDYANPQNLVTNISGALITLSNLKGYWAMSEGAGSIAYDSSGEGNNGTINGATYEPAQPRIPQLGMMNWAKSTPVSDEVTLIPNPNNTSQDILGNAVRDRLNSFNLDGSGYSSVANSSTLQFGTDAFTIQAWIKPFSLAADNRILTKGVTGSGEFMISVGGDGLSARVFAKDSNGNQLDTSNDFSSLTINSWQMITVIIDTPNDRILFFKNDENVETKTGASWTGNFNSTQPITIGNTSSVISGQFFDGLVSDALVYDRALSATEIENNYNAGLSAHTND